MEDYPRTLGEFETRFRTEDACRTYLVQLRWPDGLQLAVAVGPVPYKRLIAPDHNG